jgi:hypothetical protein
MTERERKEAIQRRLSQSSDKPKELGYWAAVDAMAKIKKDQLAE